MKQECSLPIPAHSTEELPWAFQRRLRGVDTWQASVPPFLAQVPLTLPPELATLCQEARTAITRLDVNATPILAAINPFLMRTEAIASSRIEEENTTVDQLARAHAGLKAPASARRVESAVDALATLASLPPGQAVELDVILRAHERLLADDSMDAIYAGRLRTVPNWIGGPDRHPLGADHVPPAPARVPDLIADLLEFMRRGDTDPVAAAAVAHAQFENIHPFVDGNGRIGRALLAAHLKARGLSASTTIPIAAALVAGRARYFEAITQARSGEAAPIVEVVARAIMMACHESEVSLHRLAALPSQWREAVRPRAGSAVAALLERLLERPVIDSEDARFLAGASASAAYRAVDHLVEAGVLRPLTQSRRNQAWAAGAVLDESEALLDRIAAAANGSPS